MRIRPALAAIVLLVAPTAMAGHWAKYGWEDRHYRYPAKPSGYSAIVSAFGEPGPGSNTGCKDNPDSRGNRFNWYTADDGKTYAVVFHKKLGGTTSSNLDNDVRGHIANAHWDADVKSGIWGHLCRKIAGTTKWSTHSWGIAVDQNARYEHVGSDHKHCHSVTSRVAGVWTDHQWTHGVSFGDCMHFQYASGY